MNTQKTILPDHVVEFQQVVKPNTYTDIISCTSSKLRPFEAKYGKQVLIDYVSLSLTQISQMMSFEVSPEMMLVAADLIIQDYPDTKLSDFKMFGADVLRGKVGGKLFRWDTRTILEAWREYYANREEAFATYRESKHREEKQAYLDAYAKVPVQRDMAKEYEILKKQGLMAALTRKWKGWTLQEICSDQGKDYSVLLDRCKSDCLEAWSPESVIPFDEYLKLHLVRVLNEVRSNPEALGNYC